jgi:hypothetical protein
MPGLFKADAAQMIKPEFTAPRSRRIGVGGFPEKTQSIQGGVFIYIAIPLAQAYLPRFLANRRFQEIVFRALHKDVSSY